MTRAEKFADMTPEQQGAHALDVWEEHERSVHADERDAARNVIALGHLIVAHRVTRFYERSIDNLLEQLARARDDRDRALAISLDAAEIAIATNEGAKRHRARLRAAEDAKAMIAAFVAGRRKARAA